MQGTVLIIAVTFCIYYHTERFCCLFGVVFLSISGSISIFSSPAASHFRLAQPRVETAPLGHDSAGFGAHV